MMTTSPLASSVAVGYQRLDFICGREECKSARRMHVPFRRGRGGGGHAGRTVPSLHSVRGKVCAALPCAVLCPALPCHGCHMPCPRKAEAKAHVMVDSASCESSNGAYRWLDMCAWLNIRTPPRAGASKRLMTD